MTNQARTLLSVTAAAFTLAFSVSAIAAALRQSMLMQPKNWLAQITASSATVFQKPKTVLPMKKWLKNIAARPMRKKN